MGQSCTVQLEHLWKNKILLPPCTSLSQLHQMKQSGCQKIICFMQEKVSLKNFIWCKFMYFLNVQSIDRERVTTKIFHYKQNSIHWCNFWKYISSLNQRYVFEFSYAIEVEVGDEVLVQGNDKLNPEKIINVSNLMMLGEYKVYSIGIFPIYV